MMFLPSMGNDPIKWLLRGLNNNRRKTVAKGKNWIQGAIKKPGALHKALGVPSGKKIPTNKLAIKKGDSPVMKKRKNLAKTLGRMNKSK